MDSILYKEKLDRIYRILWIFVFISFQMKEIKVNPLRGISLRRNLALSIVDICEAPIYNGPWE